MGYKLGVNWYARLLKQKAELEHKLEDIRAHNKILIKKLKKYETIIEELKAELARAKEDHQYDNLVHKRELESLKNPIHDLRKKGLM